ncbi:MAG TPA: hypothetical protein VFI73_02375 [Candidatus Nitrosopolaris sp.]|nr:hypothetical protein [Candidatus Nitrosopolaris sp.]
MQKNPKFVIVSTGFLAAALILGTLTTAITFSTPLASGLILMPGNQTSSTGGKNMTIPGGNMTFVGNMMPGKKMTIPGGNMTFGASLQNAKMHLTEARMDLKTGNTKGTMMQLNLTAQAIKMHEQEIKSLMMEVKSMMMGMKDNATSHHAMSKNATS